jgi:hypothetical protein
MMKGLPDARGIENMRGVCLLRVLQQQTPSASHPRWPPASKTSVPEDK